MVALTESALYLNAIFIAAKLIPFFVGLHLEFPGSGATAASTLISTREVFVKTFEFEITAVFSHFTWRVFRRNNHSCLW